MGIFDRIGRRLARRAAKTKRIKEFVKRSENIARRKGRTGGASKGLALDKTNTALAPVGKYEIVKSAERSAFVVSPTKGANTAALISNRSVKRYVARRDAKVAFRKKPKVVDAEIVDDAVIAAVKKGQTGRIKKLLFRGGTFVGSVAAWGIAGYYFDKALAHLMGEDEADDVDGSKDNKELSGEEAVLAAHALADELHGYGAIEEQIFSYDGDCDNDVDFVRIHSLFSELVRKPQLDPSASDAASIAAYDSDSRLPLFIARLADAVKKLADLSGRPDLVKLNMVQLLCSDDDFVVNSTGFHDAFADKTMFKHMYDSIAEDHFGAIASFIDEYRDEAVDECYKDLVKDLEVTESSDELYDRLSSGKFDRQYAHLAVLGSITHDRFEDTLGTLAKWRIDADGDDDETAMLNLIFGMRQPSLPEVGIILNT